MIKNMLRAIFAPPTFNAYTDRKPDHSVAEELSSVNWDIGSYRDPKAVQYEPVDVQSVATSTQEDAWRKEASRNMQWIPTVPPVVVGIDRNTAHVAHRQMMERERHIDRFASAPTPAPILLDRPRKRPDADGPRRAFHVWEKSPKGPVQSVHYDAPPKGSHILRVDEISDGTDNFFMFDESGEPLFGTLSNVFPKPDWKVEL